MKTTNQHAPASTQRTPRAEAALVLEDELVTLSLCSERAALMAEDLVDVFFNPCSEETGRKDRVALIMMYFENARIRAEILQSIIFEMKKVAEGLYAEVRTSAKG